MLGDDLTPTLSCLPLKGFFQIFIQMKISIFSSLFPIFFIEQFVKNIIFIKILQYVKSERQFKLNYLFKNYHKLDSFNDENIFLGSMKLSY